MAVHLADSLLALAASVDGDGGQAVCRTLASLLRDTVPFEAGEVVLRQERGLHRFPFGGDARPVAGEDVVAQVLGNGAPLRLDDPRDLEAFPETRDRMAESGFKSALVLPLGTILHVPGPPRGASRSGVLALARHHGWAFVGASLNFLGPLAAMAGLALDRSLVLTALGHPAGPETEVDLDRRDALRREGATLVAELLELRAEKAAHAGEVEALRARVAAMRDETADARSAALAAQSALDQALSRCHELKARLDRGEFAGSSCAAPDVVPPSVPPAGTSRRSRRRRRGAFEPSGGAGSA
jgi:hypothetical protein